VTGDDEVITSTELPPGPALLYVHSGIDSVKALTRVDTGLPTEGGPISDLGNRRELRLLRALCEHVLVLLDEADVR
jgi:hypothetical protein